MESCSMVKYMNYQVFCVGASVYLLMPVDLSWKKKEDLP